VTADINWVEHTRFLTPDARASVQAEVTGYLDRLGPALSEYGLEGTNVYLGGSLARREPTAQCDDGTWHLASDFDFVAVTRRLRKNHTVYGLAEHLQQGSGHFLPTVFIVAEEQLAGMRSFIGYDLWPMLAEPIYSEFDLVFPQRPVVGRAERFEVFVHQLNAVLLYPHDEVGMKSAKHFRASRAMHAQKAKLEGLRMAVDPGAHTAPGYNDLLEPWCITQLAGIAPASQVEDMLRARELSQYADDGSDRDDALMLRCLYRFFGVGETHDTELELISAVLALGEPRTDLLSIFQLCVPLLLLACDPRNRISKTAAAGCLTLLGHVDTARDVPTAGDAVRQLLSTDPAAMAWELCQDRGSATKDAWCAVRRDYYNRLGDHNFGRQVYDNYGINT